MWTIPVLLVAFAGPARATVVDETRNLSGYRGVSIGGGIVARVEAGPDLVVLRGEEEDLRLIRTEIKDGVLRIGWEPDVERPSKRPISALVRLQRAEVLGSSGGARVEAAVPAGEELELQASGGSELRVGGKLATRSLAVQVSGGARLQVQAIDTGEAAVALSGAARLSIAGRAGNVTLATSGGAELAGESFASTGLQVQGSGGSVTRLRVDGPVAGALSGGARVHAPGATSVNVASSGGARVYREM
jgi:hypothetical protein